MELLIGWPYFVSSSFNPTFFILDNDAHSQLPAKYFELYNENFFHAADLSIISDISQLHLSWELFCDALNSACMLFLFGFIAFI